MIFQTLVLDGEEQFAKPGRGPLCPTCLCFERPVPATASILSIGFTLPAVSRISSYVRVHGQVRDVAAVET